MINSAILGTLLVSFVSWIYFWSRRKYSYFSNRNVPFREPSFPFGSLNSLCASQSSYIKWFRDFYFEFKDKHPFAGFFVGFEPVIVLSDLNLVQSILATNFGHFSERAVYNNERDDPLSAVIMTMEGEKWRNMRTKLSGTFSNHNVRNMFESVHEICGNLLDHLEVNFVQKDLPFNARNVSMRFICDSIGSCAFGLDCGALRESDPYLVKIVDVLFPHNRWSIFYWFLTGVYGDLSRFLGLKLLPEKLTEQFRNMIFDAVKFREENNIRRNDFLNTLIQMKSLGCLMEDESGEELQKLSFKHLQSQAVAIFFVGFYTAGTTLSFALFELAANKSIQERLREEVMEGLLTYEALEGWTYLEQVVNETLRKYPPLPIINRATTEEIRLPGMNCTLKKGDHVYIPISGIHHDPDIYPDPDRFDPERMTQEKIKNRHPYSFLPYGGGPRKCMGYKFGLLQVKLAIVRILRNYKLSVNCKTKQPLDFIPRRLEVDVREGIWLDARRIVNDR